MEEKNMNNSYLQSSIKYYQNLISYISECTKSDIFEWDTQTGRVHILTMNHVFSSLPEFVTFEAFQEHLLAFFKRAQDASKLIDLLNNSRRKRSDSFCELRLDEASGKVTWFRISLSHPDTARPCSVAGIVENITQERTASMNYLIETRFYHTLLDEKDAYGHLDVTEDRLVALGGIWNLYNELKDTVSYSQIIETFIFKIVLPEDRDNYLHIMKVENLKKSYEEGIYKLGCEFRRVVEQNKMVWMQLGIHLFKEPYSGHLMALLHITNINAQKQQDLQLHYESQRDQLTDVYNKKVAERLIRDYLRSADADDRSALLIVDLDCFKQINDTLGHRTGDEVLIRTASCLESIFRKNDIVGRFGGDEFIVFLENIQHRELIIKSLEIFFRKLKEEVQPPVTCSIGIAPTTAADDYETAFEKADQALYRAKSLGRNQFCFYEECTLPSDSTPAQAASEAVTTAPGLTAPSSLSYTKTAAAPEGNLIDALVGCQGDMAYLIEPNTYKLICGNQAFYDRIGRTPSECMKSRCYELMYVRNSPCPFCAKANWSPDKFFIWRDMNTALEQEFLIKNKLVEWEGSEALLTVAVDISNDKSLWDIIDSEATESHMLLSGIQRMEEADTLYKAVWSMLDTIGHFFRADMVSFWEAASESAVYECACRWQLENDSTQPPLCDPVFLSAFFRKHGWNASVIIESPEAMLNYSFELYQHMQDNGVLNYRFIRMNDHGKDCGCILIRNSSANLQNQSFLESGFTFFINDMKKRRVFETLLNASRTDTLSDVRTQRSYEQYMLEYNPDDHTSLGIAVASVDGLKEINRIKGQLVGEYYIKRLAAQLDKIFGAENCYRINEKAFLVIADGIDCAEMEAHIALLNRRLSEEEDFSTTIGYSWDNIEKDLSKLLRSADTAARL